MENEPTGWRGGTGKFELLLQKPDGWVYLQAVTRRRNGRWPGLLGSGVASAAAGDCRI